jgi:hypothetical protein
VKDGVKYTHAGSGPLQQSDGTDAAAKAETLRIKPLDYQSYGLFHDGSCYNEICEFTFDDDKRGHGYYYKANTDAREQEKEPQQQGPNMTEVQEAEMKASIIQGLIKSADGLSHVEGKDIGQAEEEYVVAAGQVRYEAQRARTADSEIKGRGDESAQTLKEPHIGQRVSFHPHGSSKTKLIGSVIKTDERTVTLKCGSKKIPAIREKGNFFEAPPLKREQTKEFAKNQACQLMGSNANVFFAQDKGIYKGGIIGMTPTYAIQKVNGETAILHRLKDLQSQDKNAHGLVRESNEVSIVKDENGVSVAPRDKEREEKVKTRELQKSRGSQSR